MRGGAEGKVRVRACCKRFFSFFFVEVLYLVVTSFPDFLKAEQMSGNEAIII